MDYSDLSKDNISFSAPCRLDMGGTLDISTFYVPLNRYNPSTFNIALDLRTKVTISPYKKDYVKISSKGFNSAEFKSDEAPFTHQMGMMFAIASFFGVSGVQIDIKSSSPPRSGLGGSSVAAVAIVSAFMRLLNPDKKIDDDFRRKAAIIAHKIEDSTLPVPCGTQDHLAAAFGGVNLWSFDIENIFTRDNLVNNNQDFSGNFIVAYCGAPHESVDINGRWVNSFIKGEKRERWVEICSLANDFAHSLKNRDISKAVELMNQEVDIRISMTPDVFDNTGKKFLNSARETKCSARFTGAGGGGCVWALGEKSDIKNLKNRWDEITKENPEALIISNTIDTKGILEDLRL